MLLVQGLQEAVQLVVPSARSRFCLRHMYNNFKVVFPGKSYKDALMAAAYATTIYDFTECMERIKSMNDKAYEWLMKRDPTTWSLHGFDHYCKSDMILNNGAESFNSCILEAREMPIESMCEWIRRKLMTMFVNKRNAMRKHTWVLTPKAMEKIEAAKKEALTRCKCYGQDDKYEVDHYSKTFVVDLARRTCGCNLWDITGLPCCHAICCIMKRRVNVIQFVDPYYHKETYLRAYNESINPMSGHEQWERTTYPRPLPPKFVIQPGRPKKSRKKELGEGKKRRFRVGGNHCSKCGLEGHYKNKCTNPPKQPEVSPTIKSKGGRPSKSSTVKFDTKKRKYTKKVVDFPYFLLNNLIPF